MATIYLAGGCFWGVEKYIASINGVLNTEVGYANGRTDSPTYGEVSTGLTGDAETVRVDYDPTVAPLRVPARPLLQGHRPDVGQPAG